MHKKIYKKQRDINEISLLSEKLIDIFSNSISSALSAGNSVEIRGFGRWYCKKLKENFYARNPLTNKLIYKPERVKVRFKSSKKLKEIINKWEKQKYL